MTRRSFRHWRSSNWISGKVSACLHSGSHPGTKQKAPSSAGATTASNIAAARNPRTLSSRDDQSYALQVSLDRYGRTVAVCTVAGDDLGEWLVRNGLALDWPQYSKHNGLKSDIAAGPKSTSGLMHRNNPYLCSITSSARGEASAAAASQGKVRAKLLLPLSGIGQTDV